MTTGQAQHPDNISTPCCSPLNKRRAAPAPAHPRSPCCAPVGRRRADTSGDGGGGRGSGKQGHVAWWRCLVNSSCCELSASGTNIGCRTNVLPPRSKLADAHTRTQTLLTLGAPVMEPPGNAARTACTQLASGLISPLTVLTSWCTLL